MADLDFRTIEAPTGAHPNFITNVAGWNLLARPMGDPDLRPIRYRIRTDAAGTQTLWIEGERFDFPPTGESREYPYGLILEWVEA